jgi:DNA-binding CsgD family transcriptional regulator
MTETDIYIFLPDAPPLIISRPESPEQIVRRVNQGDWEPYLGYQQQPTAAWHAARVGRYVILAEPEPNIQFPDLGITPREMQALQCLAAGLSMGQAAQRMRIDVRTLRNYCDRLRAKLKCRTVAQLLGLAAAIGLVKPDLDGLFT